MASVVAEEQIKENVIKITYDPSQHDNGMNIDDGMTDEVSLSQSLIGPSPEKKKQRKKADVDPNKRRTANFSNEEVHVIVEEAIAH